MMIDPQGRKIEYAPQIGVEQYEDIAQDFLEHVVEHPEAWISDLSSVYDFEYDTKEEAWERIKKRYGVDVSDIEDLNLVKIFERIRILSPNYQ